MAHRNEGPFTMTAGEDLVAHRFVKISSNAAVYADAGDEPVGLTHDAADEDGAVTVWPLDNHIHKVEAAGAIADGAALYVGNHGKIDDDVQGAQIGINMKGGAAVQGEIVSCLVWGPRGGSDLATSRASTIYWIDDFIDFRISETADAADWLATLVDTGNDNVEVHKPADDAPGGWATITTNDANADSNELQRNGEAFKLATGKELRFKTRVMLGDVDKIDFFIGLAISDTTVLAGCTDLVGFFVDHDGNVDAEVRQDSTASKSDTGVDIEDGTIATAATKALTLEFHWDGAGVVRFYIDGVLVATKTDNNATILIPDDLALSPTICVKTANAAAETAWVDFIEIVADR